MKKLLCLLLVIAISLCCVGCKDSIRELRLPRGEAMNEEALEEWFEDFDNLADEEADKNELSKARWYKFSITIIDSKEEDDDFLSISKVDLKGKIYLSPFAYDVKMKLSGDIKQEFSFKNEDDETEKATSNIKIDAVYVHGESFIKIETKTRDKDGKDTEIEYSTGNLFEPIYSLLFPSVYSTVLPFTSEDATLLKTKRGIAGELRDEEDGQGSLSQFVYEFYKNSTEVKSMKLYKREIVLDTMMGSFSNYTLIELSPALFGSVKRPRDYYKYY